MSILQVRAAMEMMLATIPILPANTIVSSDGKIFTTSAPHNLVTKMIGKVVGHSTLANGDYYVKVLSATTFSLVSSVTSADISTTAGTGGTITPQLIAWENVTFDALNNVPFEKVNFIHAKPENPTLGDGFYRERGYMQLTLYYPSQRGPYDALSRAELIRSTFPRGSSFSNNGVVVHIDRTADITPGVIADESYTVFVRVPFYADINS